MEFLPILDQATEGPLFIAGPCSAESEEQVLNTAQQLSQQPVHLYRAGIWKPRTRPNAFEGVGVVGLPWLRKVKEQTGMKTTTEVANREHVYEALKHGVDVLWIGARTTVNPFSVQEIADALRGVDVPVLVKNPVNPDLSLWVGAIERLYNVGLRRIAAIHRGFSFHGETRYRNVPQWQIPIELRRKIPGLPIICDNSHICGRRDLLQEVAQQAFDLSFDGLMTEVHPDPDQAWSDAAQQITPDVYRSLVQALKIRKSSTDDPAFLNNLDDLRQKIDQIDQHIFELLGQRMRVAQDIGRYKKNNNVAILQSQRWSELLDIAHAKGSKEGLSSDFVTRLLMAIHDESIAHQEKIMNQ